MQSSLPKAGKSVNFLNILTSLKSLQLARGSQRLGTKWLSWQIQTIKRPDCSMNTFSETVAAAHTKYKYWNTWMMFIILLADVNPLCMWPVDLDHVSAPDPLQLFLENTQLSEYVPTRTKFPLCLYRDGISFLMKAFVKPSANLSNIWNTSLLSPFLRHFKDKSAGKKCVFISHGRMVHIFVIPPNDYGIQQSLACENEPKECPTVFS